MDYLLSREGSRRTKAISSRVARSVAVVNLSLIYYISARMQQSYYRYNDEINCTTKLLSREAPKGAFLLRMV